VTDDGRHASGAEADTTNQRMELTAVLRALEALDGPVHIHSDSTYVVNCFRDRWYEGWKARGWKNTQKKPVANRDLWEPLIELFLPRKDEIQFTWVKGHAGNRLNELADSLAVAEVDRLRERERERLPSEDGPARLAGDRVGGTAGDGAVIEGPQPPWSIEQAILVTGTRQLDSDRSVELEGAIDQLDPLNDIVVSGLRLGAELEGAERAVERGVPLAVVLPYADPVRVWSDRDRARFDKALAAAEWVVDLDLDPGSPSKAIAARNAWLRTAAIGAVIVGDDDETSAAELAGLGVVAI
jgi:ribonuclease HI